MATSPSPRSILQRRRDGQIEETYYLWDDGRWWEFGASSWGTGPDYGPRHLRSGTRLARFVAVSWAGQRHSVPVDPDGEWWISSVDAPDDWEGDAPAMPEASYKIVDP